jgi:multicomponent Na+:H+ antiporter subunit C
MILYFLTLVLFVMGVYCLIAKKNIIKKIIGLTITDYAINLFIIIIGYRAKGIAPIMFKNMTIQELADYGVDPLPQALVLTSIVIGLSVAALMVVMAVRLHQKYGTFDLTQITKLKG